jgi:hypothetical protein
LALLNHKMHALGGYDGNKYLAASEAYDAKTNQWVMAPEVCVCVVCCGVWCVYVLCVAGCDVHRLSHVALCAYVCVCVCVCFEQASLPKRMAHFGTALL